MSSPLTKLTEDVVILDRGNYTTCTVHLHGGTILSYRVRDKEILYMKKKTAFNKFSPIRGGIKFTFPFFGKRVSGPKHGFARYVPWSLDEGPTTKPDGNVEAVFSLSDTEYTRAVWSFKFKISYRLTLCLNELRIDMKVENTCKYFPCYFTALRHSIFKVHDITKCEIYGLSNCKYISVDPKTPSRTLRSHPDSEMITVQGRKYWDLYLDTPDTIEVRNIDEHGQRIRVTSTNSTSKNVLIYNPWKEIASQVDAIEKHDDNEYLYCLGVSQGHISSNIRLGPKQIWKSYHIIEVVDDDRQVEKLAKLLDDPLSMFQNVCLKPIAYFDSNKET